MSAILLVPDAGTNPAEIGKKAYQQGYQAGLRRSKRKKKPRQPPPTDAEHRALIVYYNGHNCEVCGDKLDPEHPRPLDRRGCRRWVRGIVCEGCEKALDLLGNGSVAAMTILHEREIEFFRDKPHYLYACLCYLDKACDDDGTPMSSEVMSMHNRWFPLVTEAELEELKANREAAEAGRLPDPGAHERWFRARVEELRSQIRRYRACCVERGVEPNPDWTAILQARVDSHIEANPHMSHVLKD